MQTALVYQHIPWIMALAMRSVGAASTHKEPIPVPPCGGHSSCCKVKDEHPGPTPAYLSFAESGQAREHRGVVSLASWLRVLAVWHRCWHADERAARAGALASYCCGPVAHNVSRCTSAACMASAAQTVQAFNTAHSALAWVAKTWVAKRALA